MAGAISEQHRPGQQRYVVGAITTRLTVTVPATIVGGDLVRVAAPDGSYHSVVVPAGLSAGQQFSVELLAGNSEGGAAELARLKSELEAERHMRRDSQQEATRFRSAYEALQQKRAADHAFFRDSIKRQRRAMGVLPEASNDRSRGQGDA